MHSQWLHGAMMGIDARFRAKYRDIQERMKALAEKEHDIFLPDLEPPGPVDWVLVCMEPSLGRWAPGANEQQRREAALSRITDGFRNHLPSGNVAIFHFCIRRYLCGPGQRYHITDLAKGARLVEDAAPERDRRYRRWYPLLQEEIDVVATPRAGIIAVGRRPHDFLTRQGLPRLFGKIVHYSDLAQKAWRDGIKGHKDDFEAFKDSVTLNDLETTSREVLTSAQMPTKIREEELEKVRRSKLNTSRQYLLFNYKLAFESMRRKLECSGSFL